MSNPQLPPTTHKDPHKDYKVSRMQNFEAVLLKKGVNSWEATPDDFKRIPVTANSISEAHDDPELVAAQAEYVTVQITAPGFRTEMEVDAGARAHKGTVTDPRKI